MPSYHSLVNFEIASNLLQSTDKKRVRCGGRTVALETRATGFNDGGAMGDLLSLKVC
jgi:hypothetical protein